MTWNAGLYFYALVLLDFGINLSIFVSQIHYRGPQFPDPDELPPIANILLAVSRRMSWAAFLLVLAGGLLTLVNVFLRVPLTLFPWPAWPWWGLVATLLLGVPVGGFLVALVSSLIQGQRFRQSRG